MTEVHTPEALAVVQVDSQIRPSMGGGEVSLSVAPAEHASVRTGVFRRPEWLTLGAMFLWILATAVISGYDGDGDSPVYLDISDFLHAHRWHAVVNACWFPVYPALLTAGKALFGFRLRYELLAAKLVDSSMQVLFVVCSIFFASSVRRLLLVRGFRAEEMLPRNVLYLWTATVAYFLAMRDLTQMKPDALSDALFLLMFGLLVRSAAECEWKPFLLAGLVGGLAFWTKAFAFPLFVLSMVCFGIAHWRNRRVLRGLLLCTLCFGLVSGPWIWQLSRAKGRWSAGDAGSLNMAWYINGADRFNPVRDPSLYDHGHAIPNFKHPGELLWKNPEISYYSATIIPGSTPQWDDPTYWSDGLKPQFIPAESLRQFLLDTRMFLSNVPMRLPVLALLCAFVPFGFCFRKNAAFDRTLVALTIICVGGIGSYLMVHLEQRYLTAFYIALAGMFAACSMGRGGEGSRSLDRVIVLLSALVLTYSVRDSLASMKAARLAGDRPLHALYDVKEVSAGARLAALYPPGSSVACMGDACFSYWAHYGRVSASAVIDTGNGMQAVGSANEGCMELMANPGALDALSKRGVRAVVARFDNGSACSPEWRPLESTNTYFYLPIG